MVCGICWILCAIFVTIFNLLRRLELISSLAHFVLPRLVREALAKIAGVQLGAETRLLEAQLLVETGQPVPSANFEHQSDGRRLYPDSTHAAYIALFAPLRSSPCEREHEFLFEMRY
jgi:hypothetical protein